MASQHPSPAGDSLFVDGLSVDYRPTHGHSPALSDVTFSLPAGESMCLIGSSGSAKTTLLRAVAGLLPSGTHVGGAVQLPLGGQLDAMDAEKLRVYRRDHLGVVFQDAVGSLVPGVAIGTQLTRAYRHRRRLDDRAARNQALGALHRVGFANPEESWRKPPSALSGGMCQRVMMALALAAPKLALLLADEPISSLDAVSSMEVLDLLFQVHRDEGAILLWVSHDARIARRFDWVGVLEEGRLLEFRRSAEFFSEQRTVQGRALLEASRALGES